MNSTSLFAAFFSLSLIFLPPVAADGPHDRKALEIIIGGGGGGAPSPDDEGCPPPPPSPLPVAPIIPKPSPPPPPPPKPPTKPPSPPQRPPFLGFENEAIQKAFNVIQRFRKKITGGNRTVLNSWRGKNVCGYIGFSCAKPPGTKNRAISGVDFNSFFKFSGDNLKVGGFLDEFDNLTYFHVNSNFFTSPIPRRIYKQPFLYELDFSNNRLSGLFPNEVLEARKLTFLDLRFNDLCGPIPFQLFEMDIITAIFINNNRFTGDLPGNLGRTPARYLTFASNLFTGRIPSSIGEAKKTLEEIVFRNNSFDGCLPYEVGFLEKATLFDAGKNRLTGPIPVSFACLGKLEILYLADNRFYGPVPEMVCKLPKLGNFTLRNNYFTEVGPECRKLIKKKVLDISENCIIDLPNQKSKAECAEFFSKPWQSCGNDKSLKYLFCKGNWYLHPHVANPSDQNVTVAPKKAYAALSPDGR